MSKWIVETWYKDGGSSLSVHNHLNTAIRIADEMRANNSRKVSIYEEVSLYDKAVLQARQRGAVQQA